MKNMKFSAARLLILLLLFLGACETTEEDDISFFPDARDKFIGSWSVNNEDCGKAKYLVGIRKDLSNSAQVLIDNFGFSQSAVPDTAIIAGSSIVLYKQVNSEGWIVQGSGSYNESKELINWQYTLLISGFQESCTATYIKAN